jgi:hypothetical protein
MVGILLVLVVIPASADKKDKPPGSPGEDGQATLSFWSDAEAYNAGEVAVLQWSSDNTRFCSASGDWGGKLPVAGTYTTHTLEAGRSYQYALKCAARRGGVEQIIALSVGSAPGDPAGSVPPPTVTFAALSDAVPAGTMAEIQWSSSDASTCTAGGGWSGEKPTSGSEVVGPVFGSTEFSLSCRGDGGGAIEMVNVAAISSVDISWIPPDKNVDGSPLTDLSGYRIYVGNASRNYVSTIGLSDSAADSFSLDLSSGRYFISMTAIDRDGNESGYSNEVERFAP